MHAVLKLLPAALLAATLSACNPTITHPFPGHVTAPAQANAFSEYLLIKPLTDVPVRQFTAAAQVTDPTKSYRAVLNTSKGAIVLDLYPQVAPVAVNNFVFLALNRFYDGTRFHRVIDGFMAQGGDPNSAVLAAQDSWGNGNPGYQFMAELSPTLKFDRAGQLGMARGAGYNTQGSQFFITLAPAQDLNGEYTIFGQVVSGMNVLQSLTRNYTNRGPLAGQSADTVNSVQIYVKP